MRIYKNVWFLASLAVLVFLSTLYAAWLVGNLEGAFGCGGGTIGAMIPVAALLIGLLIGVMVKFAPNAGNEAPDKEE